MKQLLFAGSFAILAFITYGVNASSQGYSGKHSMLSSININDTTPKLDTNPRMKKDTMKKKKYGGKDSLLRRDTTNPLRDTSNHQ